MNLVLSYWCTSLNGVFSEPLSRYVGSPDESCFNLTGAQVSMECSQILSLGM